MGEKPDWIKKACQRCGKKELEKCLEEDGKTFCCQVCFGKFKKEEKGEKPVKKPVNICDFC